jgi:hypothetical protein
MSKDTTEQQTNGEQADITAVDVLDSIDAALSDSKRVELTDEQMEALEIWTDDVGQRQPDIKSKKDVDPVSWSLYDVSDVGDRSRGEYLAVETHTKQQGNRYTRPYATGLGKVSFDATVQDIDDLRDDIAEVCERRGVKMVDNSVLADLKEGLEVSSEEFAHIALEGNVWAAAFTGDTLYVEPEVSHWEGCGPIFDDVSDLQEKAIREAGSGWSTRLNYLDTNSSFFFQVEVTLE